jgi:hypothetical protein
MTLSDELQQSKESVSDLRAAAVILKEERDALQAKLSALEKQEPVALIRTWRKNGDLHAELNEWVEGLWALPEGDHSLYAQPVAQKDKS